MVLKSRLIVKMGEAVQTINITLVSAKEEPVDPSIFEVPGDYKEWTPPSRPASRLRRPHQRNQRREEV